MKRLEWLGKIFLAVVVALLWWRPSRRRSAISRLSSARKLLLVRIDNRVGEALLMTPVVQRLARANKDFEIHLLVHPKTRRVIEGLPGIGKIWDFSPTFAALRELRAARFDVVVDCGNWDTESVTSAVVTRLIATTGVAIGPRHFPAGWMADLPMPPLTTTRSEAEQRSHLVSLLAPRHEPARLSFRTIPPVDFARMGAALERGYVVINPGGRLQIRRVPADAFRSAAQTVAELGLIPLVTWGPGEEDLAKTVGARCPQALLAPSTTIDELAALMHQARATICNNTGPMHLAVAVGSPTCAFFCGVEVERWGHAYSPHRMVDLSEELEKRDDVRPYVASVVREFVQGLLR
jgi:ADP-heptose:LPS heptosyltransferase